MLQFITHTNERYGYLSGAIAALDGGCRWVQLRMKDATDEEVMEVGRELLAACRERGATFIVDDRVEVVKALGADGVHLGKNDMSPAEARKILGAEAIIGGTANTLEDVVELHRMGVNYVGVGPFRYTTTKKNLSPLLGTEGYAKIVKGCKERGIELPVVAIGGITTEDIASIMECGITGIALSGMILSGDAVANTAEVLAEIERNKEI